MKKLSAHKKTTSYTAGMLLIIFLLGVLNSEAQTSDTIPAKEKNWNNSIKINITSNIIYKKSFQLAYERVLNERQSINIFGGYNQFPTNLDLSSPELKLTDATKKSGYSIGAEYRFYLQKENKHTAPHGVYLAPFVSYYRFNSDRTLVHTDSSGSESANLNMKTGFLNVGGELGYQFVIWKRFVVDAVLFGPSYTHYRFGAKLQGQLNSIDRDDALNDIIDAWKEKIPLLDRLADGEEINESGVERFWSVGFRYCVHIGFRF